MNTCTFQESITVSNPNCPDWTQLIIDPGMPTLTTNSGPASFTPTSGSMQNSTAQCTAQTAGIGLSSALCTATYTGYNRKQCNCLLTVKWTKTGTNFSAGSDRGQVDIAAGLGGVNVNFDGSTPDGTYTFPFFVSDGTSAPYNINVSVSVQATVFLGQLSDVTLNLQASIANV